MLHRLLLSIALFGLLLSFAACNNPENGDDDDDTTPTDTTNSKGDRKFAVTLNTAEQGDWIAAVNTAIGLDVDYVQIAINWQDIDLGNGSYDLSGVEYLNATYPGLKMTLIIDPDLPTDLLSLSYRLPVVKTRFRSFLDTIRSKSPNLILEGLFVGYEMHNQLGTVDTTWNAFGELLEVARSRSAYLWGEDVVFSTVASYNVMFDINLRGLYNRLFTLCNAYAINYTPILADFTVPNANAPLADLSSISGLYPAKPIYIVGVVYPTAAQNNSSEAQQASFVANLFTAWDQQKSQIKWISWLYQHDLAPAEVDSFLIGSSVIGSANESNARSYFGSLGLFTSPGAGAPKAAVAQLQAEFQSRNW